MTGAGAMGVVPAFGTGAAGGAVAMPAAFTMEGAGAAFAAKAVFRAVETLAARAADLGHFLTEFTLHGAYLFAQGENFGHKGLQLFGLSVGVGGERFKFHLLLHQLLVKGRDGGMMFLDELFPLGLAFCGLLGEFSTLFLEFGALGFALGLQFGLLFFGQFGFRSGAGLVGNAMFTAYHVAGAGAGSLFGIGGHCGGRARRKRNGA